jgi:hypothetical protein
MDEEEKSKQTPGSSLQEFHRLGPMDLKSKA